MGNPYAPPSGPRPPRGEAPPVPDRRPDGTEGTPPGLPGPTPRRGPSPTPPAPGHPGAPRRSGTPAPDPEAARRATRKVLHFGLLLLGVIVLMSLPFPWRVATLVVVLGAIVAGVRALLAVWRARMRGVLAPALVVGVGLAGVMLVQIVGMVATWNIETTYQSCLDGAITVSAQERCTAEHQQSLEDWLTARMPRPIPK